MIKIKICRSGRCFNYASSIPFLKKQQKISDSYKSKKLVWKKEKIF